MPSAVIHACIAKKINRIFNIDEELFILGNITPDCWRNCKNFGNRQLSHFFNQNMNGEDYISFYNKYKNYLNDPFVFGYLVHLMTDFYWRKNVTLKNKDILEKARLPINMEVFRTDSRDKCDKKNFIDDEHIVLCDLAKYYGLSKIHYNQELTSVIEEIDLTGLNDTINYINEVYFELNHHDKNIYDFDKTIYCIDKISEFILVELNKIIVKEV